MTLKEWVFQATTRFQTAGFSNARSEVRYLVEEALELDGVRFLQREDQPLTKKEFDRLKEWMDQRLAGVPLAYLSGHKGFYKFDFLVEPGVLVPRPETEHVVEVALRRKPGSCVRVADFGCGTGCIGLSLLKEWEQATLYSIDVSEKACALTERNAQRLGVDTRTRIIHCQIEDFSADALFDVVVSNPPYLAPNDTVDPHVARYEPHLALFAEDNGLQAHRNWLQKAYSILRDGGLVVFEVGAGQSPQVQEIMREIGFVERQAEHDLASHERVVSALKSNRQ